MRCLLQELTFILVVVLIAVYVFGENIGVVLEEVFYVYAGLAIAGIALACYIGYWLTKGMNPRPPKKKTK